MRLEKHTFELFSITATNNFWSKFPNKWWYKIHIAFIFTTRLDTSIITSSIIPNKVSVDAPSSALNVGNDRIEKLLFFCTIFNVFLIYEWNWTLNCKSACADASFLVWKVEMLSSKPLNKKKNHAKYNIFLFWLLL